MLQILQMLKTVSIDENKKGLKLVIIYGVIAGHIVSLAFSIKCIARKIGQNPYSKST